MALGLKMAMVLGVLGALIGALQLWKKFGSPHPELVRKVLHMGMGLVTLSFPWLFDSPWPAIVLASLAAGGMLTLRISARLKSTVGGVIHSVSRDSYGEIYFPLSVAAVFFLSRGDPILFCVPVLILGLADALAALIGVRYGMVKFATSDGYKSVEGSLAFFTVAFLSVHVSLLLFSEIGRAESLLIGLILGLLVMMLEAIAWRGLDNLFIPVGAFLLLDTYLPLDSRALAVRLVVCLVLIGFVIVWRRQSTLRGNALLAAALFGYVAWALGGWEWLLPGLVLFISYPLISPKNETNTRRIHDLPAVSSVISGGMLWLAIATAFERPELIYIYCLTFAGHLAIMGLARMKHDFPRATHAGLLTRCVLTGWLVLFVPFVVITGLSRQTPTLAAGALIVVMVAAGLFFRFQPNLDNCPRDQRRWVLQSVSATAASVLGLIPLYIFKV